MNKRPNQQETEEDILRLQREFYSSTSSPAAKLIKNTTGDVCKTKGNASDNPQVPERHTLPDIVDLKKGAFTKSKFKKSRKKEDLTQKFTIPEEELWKQENKTGSARVILQGIVQDVMERNQELPKESTGLCFRGGFPSAFKIDRDVVKMNDDDPDGKKSLFARQFESGKAPSIGLMDGTLNTIPSMSTSSISKTESVCNESNTENDIEMITDSIKVNDGGINNENIARLKKMSANEILEEQQKLKEMLGGNMIEFLKTRTKQKNKSSENTISSPNILEMSPETSMQVDSIQSDKEADSLKHDLGIDKNVMHMEKAETEKLKWMEDVDQCDKMEKATTARFDFEGNLVPASAEISFDKGLHHHGNEPHAAGYSLDELFQLARSSFLKQRVFALTTLGRILEKRHNCSTKDHLNIDLIEVLCDSGLPFLLRWALDDEVESVYGAALYCLRAMLVSHADQITMKRISNLPFDICIPSLCPIEVRIKKNADGTMKKGKTTITDAEMVKVDVIKGFLQMQLIDRMTYIMTTCSPLLPIVEDILLIMIRISHHSKEAAYQIAMNKSLIKCIIELLPLTSHFGDIDSNTRLPFSKPLALAMRLLCCLTVASRSTALMLISDHGLTKRVACYLAAMSTNFDAAVGNQTTITLVVNSFAMWKMFVNYGLVTNLLSELHPVMMSLFQSLTSKPFVSKTQCEQINDIQCSICSLLSAHWSYIAKSNQAKNALPQPTINSLQSFHAMMLFWLRFATEEYSKRKLGSSSILGCIMGYFSNYIKGLSKADVSIDVLLSAIETLLTNDIRMLLSSNHIQDHFELLSEESDLLSSKPATNFKQIDSLRDYGTDRLSNCISNTMSSDSPHILFGGLMTVIDTACSIHKGVPEQFVKLFQMDGIRNYLKSISASKFAAKNASEIISCRLELHGAVATLGIFARVLPFVIKDIALLKLCHEAAFKIFAILPCGMESHAVRLMSNILFTPEIFMAICEGSDVISRELSHLNISSSPSGNNEKSTISVVEKYMKEQFSIVTRTYYDSCVRHMQVQDKYISKSSDTPINSQLLDAAESSIVPIDWVFLPLLEIYAEAIRSETIGVTVVEHTPQTTRIATSSLMFLLLLELWEYEAVTSLSITTKLTRILSTFLIGSNLFLEETVHSALECLLKFYTSDANLVKFNFEEKIPGIPSFYDLYLSLLQRYISSSYCDPVFANYVLLPLGGCHSIKYRQAICGEFSDIFRVFPLKANEVAFNISYLFSGNEDVRLLSQYVECVDMGRIRLEWSPLFYLIAIHHLNCFIFNTNTKAEDKEKQTNEGEHFMKLILTMDNKALKEDIIYYDTVEESNPNGFRKHANLPPTRQLMLRKFQIS